MEVWKKIKIKELERYEVSNLGNIRHIENKKNRKFSCNKGHLSFKVDLPGGKVKSFLVHRVVAITFLGDCEGKL